MDMRVLGLAGAIVLATLAGCKSDDGGNNNAGAGAMGGFGGTTGGVGGATGGVGGVGGATGGIGGTAGVMGGMTGGSAGVMGGMTGGSAGVMGGMTGGSAGVMGGMTGGAAGTEAGGGGMMGGEVTDTASCMAAAAADGRMGACSDCGCMKCLAEIMNCQDEACQSVVTCGQAAGCSGSECYCGVGVDPVVCAFTGASGPCMNEIATASGLVGTTDTCTANNQCASDLSMLSETDPNNPVQRARALSICTQGQRASAGSPPLVEPTPEIMGMCQTECASDM